MLLRTCTLLSLFLFFSLVSMAQQLPQEVARFRAEIVRARELLAQIKQARDSLEALSSTLPDSASWQLALDSLQERYTDPQELERQIDSLRASFASPEALVQQLDEAEKKLKEEIAKASEALAKEMLPEEAKQALAQLREAGKTSAEDLLPARRMLQELDLEKLSSPEAWQGMAKARALKAAGDHFAGHEAELAKARRELDKYKGRYEKLESIRDMPKGFLKQNPLKDKPILERLYVGTLWQFGSQGRFLLDLGPYAAWRFTDKLRTGAGFQYRLSVSVKEKPWLSGSEKVRGYYAFTDMDVWKGVFGRIHYERLQAPVPTRNAAGQVEQVAQAWVPGLSLGVGKNYTFYKAIQGFALVQYNVLHQPGKTPYLQPLQAKIGFFILGSNLNGKK